MLEAASDAQEFVSGKTRASLDTDRQFRYALRKALELIGEAASKITQETRSQYPQIAWQSMIGMRNILIHVYMHIDYDRVWQTASEDIPSLVAELEKIIPPENPRNV